MNAGVSHLERSLTFKVNSKWNFFYQVQSTFTSELHANKHIAVKKIFKMSRKKLFYEFQLKLSLKKIVQQKNHIFSIKRKMKNFKEKNNLRFLFNKSVSKWNLIQNTTRMIYKELRFMWFKTFVDCHCWPLVSKSFDSMWIQYFLWKKFLFFNN